MLESDDVIIPANEMLFQELCDIFEAIKKAKTRMKQADLLIEFIGNFRKKSGLVTGKKDCTVFPILRLILPQYDRERLAYGLKESSLGRLYVKILGLSKNSNDAIKLLNYKSTSHSSNESDFASVALFVIKSRCSNEGKLTVGKINDSLTILSSSDFEDRAKRKDNELTKLLKTTTAEQHKWLIRIILKNSRLGLGQQKILSCFHPDAPELFNNCNNLLQVCEEISEGDTRPIEVGVKLFTAVSPMLSERLDIENIGELPAEQFYVETKFDGERFQVHMLNGKFHYFSRRGFDFTNKFGESFDSDGLLTPLLRNAFPPDVVSFIIDGEMMGWHKMKQCFGSKGMAYDVKHLVETSVHRPCFCVYDIIYYNGKALAGPDSFTGAAPLWKRTEILSTLFKEILGVIHHTKRNVVNSHQDIINALNTAIDNSEEGIVVKQKDSYYKPNSRKAGWYKIKPEYTEDVVKDLDLMIIGAYRAANKKSGEYITFLLAVAEPPDVEGTMPREWRSVGKVSTGLSNEQREMLCKQFQPHWKDSNKIPPPPSLLVGKSKPDVWIDPDKSCILQVNATELIRSECFATNYTLRFPRVVRVRDDKPLMDALTTTEYYKLVQNSSSVQKLTTQRVGNQDLVDGEDMLSRKRKRVAKFIIVPEVFRPTANKDAVPPKSKALLGKELCVLSGDDISTKNELEAFVKLHSGTVVQNKGPKTWCLIAGKKVAKVQNAIKSQSVDVVSAEWLRSLQNSEVTCSFPHPHEYLAITGDTEILLAENYDKFGDHFTKIVNVKELKDLFKNIDSRGDSMYLLSDELMAIDRELFGGPSPYAFLRKCVLLGTPGTKDVLLRARMFGARVATRESPYLTHMVVPLDTVFDDLEEFNNKSVKIITSNWIDDCLEQKCLLPVTEYLII